MNQSQNDQTDALFHSAMVGKQIESFLASDIGRYLQARAHKAYNAAVEDFKRVDASDAEAVRKIQSEMWRAEAFMGWLSQGVQEGLTSLGILQGLDDDPE